MARAAAHSDCEDSTKVKSKDENEEKEEVGNGYGKLMERLQVLRREVSLGAGLNGPGVRRDYGMVRAHTSNLVLE